MDLNDLIIYDPYTDTMYIRLRDGPTDGGEDAGTDLVIHYSVDDVPMGYEIEAASKHADHVMEGMRLLREARIDEARRQAA